jgi:Ca2+-binding EF-hand superfamily protein
MASTSESVKLTKPARPKLTFVEEPAQPPQWRQNKEAKKLKAHQAAVEQRRDAEIKESHRSIRSLGFPADSAPFAIVEDLKLAPWDLEKLREIFLKIDVGGAEGVISTEEFMEFIDSKSTPFTIQVFQIFDTDETGFLSFGEFVSMACTYCLWTQEELFKYSFDCFDTDGGGSIDETEFMVMASYFCDADPTFPGSFHIALERFDNTDSGELDFDEYKLMARYFPVLSYPIFQFQNDLQKGTLGQNRWIELLEGRTQRKEIDALLDAGLPLPDLRRDQQSMVNMGLIEHPYASWYPERYQKMVADGLIRKAKHSYKARTAGFMRRFAWFRKVFPGSRSARGDVSARGDPSARSGEIRGDVSARGDPSARSGEIALSMRPGTPPGTPPGSPSATRQLQQPERSFKIVIGESGRKKRKVKKSKYLQAASSSTNLNTIQVQASTSITQV